MTTSEVMSELQKMGHEGTKKIFLNHGAKEPFYGVKVGDLKKIQKKVKKDHALAMELYASGNSDAMYLAGLIADENAVTKKELENWLKDAYWYMISEYTVAWLAADSPHGWELGLKWIKSKKDQYAACGWNTLGSWVATHELSDDQAEIILNLIDDISDRIHGAQNREKYTMNNFVIAVGIYIPSLTKKCMDAGRKIGKVAVNVGNTACKVPLADAYIQKVVDKGRVGKLRKMARC